MLTFDVQNSPFGIRVNGHPGLTIIVKNEDLMCQVHSAHGGGGACVGEGR